MKVTLVYPPNRDIPATPYAALTLLSGALRAAGHEVSVVDANLEVFEHLVEPETIDAAERIWHAALHACRSRPARDLARLQTLARLALVPFDRLRASSRCAEVLRSPELFGDPDRANHAYDTLSNLLRLMYAQSPVLYGHAPSFADDLFRFLEAGTIGPVHEFVDTAVVDRILAQHPDVVGISAPFDLQLPEAFAVLRALRQRAPDLPIVLGGATPTAFEHRLAPDPRFWRYTDFALFGEADLTFPQLLDVLGGRGSLDDVANLWWREGTRIRRSSARGELPDLDALPTPDFTPLPLERYFLPTKVAIYLSSRGCYYGKCTFCSKHIKDGFRMRRTSLVIEDLERIRDSTGIRHFVLWDPLTPPRTIRAVAEWNRALPDDQRIAWGAESKFEKVYDDPAFLDLLRDGNARFFQFGYESGVQRVLDLMQKGNDVGRMHRILDGLAQRGIATSVQWFIGFPTETEAEALESFRFLDRHRHAVVLSSYMGKYLLQPEDDIFASGGDLCAIDIVQDEDGHFDYHHRDPSVERFDLAELHDAYRARGDFESIKRHGFLWYLTHRPERAAEIAGFQRGGLLPGTPDELLDARPELPVANELHTFDFDLFAPDGLEADGARCDGSPWQTTHAVYVTQTGEVYAITGAERRLLELADGSRDVRALLALAGIEGPEGLRRVFDFVRRGVLAVPLDPAIPRFTGARTAEAGAGQPG